MLSASKIKLIHSLAHKKYRNENGLFLAEGAKLVEELTRTFKCAFMAATEEWLSENRHPDIEQIQTVSQDELRKASLLQTPHDVLALFHIPDNYCDINIAETELCLALDGVQDPGNLGTIVRLADWFGVNHIFCSQETADVYNPKAIQATMGAIARVQLHYTDLYQSIRSLKDCVPTYGTFMNGQSIYSENLSPNGLIIMGNEGNGISADIEKLVRFRIGIPSYPSGRPTSESLNVAMATGIILSEFRRPQESPSPAFRH